MTLATEIAKRNHKPTIAVWIDNRRVYGVKGRIVFSVRARVALCTLTLKTRPSWLQFRQRVEVSLGYNGLTRRRFTGFVEDDGRKVWPYSKTITAAGYMRWAERKSPAIVTYSSQTAQTIIADLLSRAGVPYRSIGGDNTTLGTVEDIVLGKRQSYADLIEQIDAPWLCRTFDWLPDGTVRRMQLTELPAAAAKWAYTYPGNVLSLDNPLTVREVRNRVEVKGLDDVEAYRRSDSPYVDAAHDEIHEVNSDLIETNGIADVVALLQMPTVNRLTRKVTLRVAGNPLLDPGDTISLDAPTVGINSENLWLEEISEAFDEGGYFSQLTLTGGAGEAGYPIYPPIATFGLKVTKEAFDAGAGVTVYYTVMCDGSASSSPEGKTITYAWSNDVTADTGTATTYAFKLTAAEFAAGCNVTLTVTDTSSEDDTLVRSVSDTDGEEGTIVRTMYLARETEAEATPDAGENWTTDTAVDATRTPEIAGDGHSYFNDGAALYYTDNCLGSTTLVHTFADTITAIWINEVNADRVAVGCADGKVLTTEDASSLAAATWTEQADYASSIAWVGWSYDNVLWVGVDNQIIANGVVQWELDAGYTVERLTLSFVAHYASGSDGSDAQVKRQDGVVVTWPAGYTPVRATITHHILDDILYAADDSGYFYRKPAGSDPPAFEYVTDIGGGECYHLMRDGTNPLVLWAACANGLYKTYDGGEHWYLMRAGKTLMVGYGSAPWTVVTPITVYSLPTATDPNVKALSLWNGSSNDAAPANWRDASFDDSGWAAAVEASSDHGVLSDASAKPIWPTALPANNAEQCLIRQAFALSAGVVTSATLTIRADDECVGLWINGVFVWYDATSDPSDLDDEMTISLNPSIFRPGETNIIAAQGKNVYTSKAWMAWKLEVS